METEHKFKPFDKVIWRSKDQKMSIHTTWHCDLYGCESKGLIHLVGIGLIEREDYYILPYEGNEYLVETTDDPEEEITIGNGECCFGAYRGDANKIVNWSLFQFDCIDSDDDTFKERFGEGRYFDFAIRFSDFDPNDMENTRKHVLCVKEGKIVRYKG